MPKQDVDEELMKKMFEDLDTDGNGSIDFQEFSRGLMKLNVQPKKLGYTYP